MATQLPSMNNQQNSGGGGLLDYVVHGVENAAGDVANAVSNNPVAKYFIGGAMNTAKDIGTGLGYGNQGYQQSQDAATNAAIKLQQKAQTTTDPAEKQRLLKLSQQIAGGTAQNAQQQAQSYSPDVAQNPLLRGLNTGVQVATGADIVAHPVQAVKGVVDLAKGGLSAITHPIQTLQTASDTLGNLPTIAKTVATNAVNDPNNFKMVGSSDLNKLGSRWLLGQYKNAEAVSRDPLGVVSTLKEYGLTSPEDISNAAGTVTGKVDEATPTTQAIVHRKVLDAIKSADPVDTSDIKTLAQQTMDEMTNISGTTESKALATVQKGIDNLGGATKLNSLGENLTNPEDVFQFTRKLDKLAATANKAAYDRFGNITNPTQQELAQFYSTVSDTLKQRLYTGTTSLGSGTRVGADNMRLPTSWTPEELQTLSKVGNGQLAEDVKNAKNVGDLRKIESVFTQGGKMANNVLQSSEKSPNLTQMGEAAISVLHPNPVTPAMFAASTNAGRQAIDTGLSGLAASGVGVPSATLKGSLAAQGVMHQLSPTVANPNEQNQQNQPINQNSAFPGGNSPTQTVSNYDPTIKSITDIPQNQSELKQNGVGGYGIANIYGMTDSNGNPLFISPQDAKTQQLAIDQAKNSLLYKNSQAEQARVGALQDQLNTKMQFTNMIQKSYNSALTKNNAYNQAIMDVKAADPSILNYNGSFDGFIKQLSPQYADLATQLKTLENEGAINPQGNIQGSTLLSALQTAAAGSLMQFYTNLASITGYTDQTGQGTQTNAAPVPNPTVITPASPMPRPNTAGWGQGTVSPVSPSTPNFQQAGQNFIP